MKLNSFTRSNATHCSPSSPLTPDLLKECRKLLADPSPLTPKGDYYVSPLVLQALRNEAPSATGNPAITAFFGLPVFEMPNQKAQGWLIADPHLSAAYRNGEITEEQLARFYERVQEIRDSKENKLDKPHTHPTHHDPR